MKPIIAATLALTLTLGPAQAYTSSDDLWERGGKLPPKGVSTGAQTSANDIIKAVSNHGSMNPDDIIKGVSNGAQTNADD